MKNKKIIANLIIGVLLLCLISVVHKANAWNKMEDFAGTWSLNEDKSDFGRLTAASAIKVKMLKITQTSTAITINSGNEAMKGTITVSLNSGKSRVVISQVISGIPNMLTADITLEIVNNRSFKTANRDPLGVNPLQERTYAISEDGKMLTVDYEYKNNKGDQLLAGKLVYDRIGS